MTIHIPAFGESNFAETVSNHSTRIVCIPDACEQTFISYGQYLSSNGFEKKAYRRNGGNIDKNDILSNAVWFNWEKLDDKGVPENASFAVRFMSNCPVVISHRDHRPSYVSANR